MRLTIYHAACWFLGLVAFVQLVLVGAALAVRDPQGANPQVVERVVTEYVHLPATDPPVRPVRETSAAARPIFQPPAFAVPPRPASIDQSRPAIADPVVERLVREARLARLAGDLARALVKLEEAEKSAPKDPNVLYDAGETYELMENFDRAGDYYEKVLFLGVTGAGSLFEKAGGKLREGFGSNERAQFQIGLGRIREFHDRRVVDGEKVVLTIPVLAAAGQVKDPNAVVLKVILYDKVGEELVMAAETNPPQHRWVAEPVDYRTGEENLRVTYFIPAVGVADEHLFGTRKYFGHVVELYHRGELIDQKAWPRTLATKVNAPESNPLFLPEEYLPRDLNPDNPLLPPLPR